jgi:hypothetical protein
MLFRQPDHGFNRVRTAKERDGYKSVSQIAAPGIKASIQFVVGRMQKSVSEI